MWTEAKSAVRLLARTSPSGGSATSSRWSRKDFNHPSRHLLLASATRSPRPDRPPGRAWGAGSPRRSAPSTRTGTSRTGSTACSTVLELRRWLGACGRQPSRGRRQHTDGRPRRHDERDQLHPIWSPGGPRSRSRVLDIAGINYGEARYVLGPRPVPEPDHRRHRDLPRLASTATGGWSASTPRHRRLHLDRLGLPRRGRASAAPQYRERRTARRRLVRGPYPWLLAWCGDIDITGHRRPASYYREIVFGLRDRAVHRGPAARAPRTDLRPATPVGVERLRRQLDLARIGRRAGHRRGLQRRRLRWNCCSTASPRPQARRRQPPVPRRIRDAYQPGELLAVAYTAGTETGRHLLGPPPGRCSCAPKPTGTRSTAAAPTSPTWLSPYRPGRDLLAPTPTGRCGSKSPARASCSASAAPSPQPRNGSTRPNAAPTTAGPSRSCAPSARARSG